MELNFNQIDGLVEQAFNLGVNDFVWSPLFPVGRGVSCNDLSLTIDDLVKISTHLNVLKDKYEGKMGILNYTPGITPLKMNEPTLRCGAVNYYIALLPNGDIFPCHQLRENEFKLGSVKNTTLNSIIHSTKAEFYTKEIDNHISESECNSCLLFENGFCNTGCKSLKITEGKNFYAKYPMCSKDFEGSPLNILETQFRK